MPRRSRRHAGWSASMSAQPSRSRRMRNAVGDTTSDDSSGQGAYAFGPFVVDPLKRRLWRDRSLVPISSKTFDVLVVLLEHRDHSVSKDELLNLVWPDTAVNENNLARQISSLRRALGQRPDEHDFVVTIPGHGYRFVATVHQLADVPPELRNGGNGHAPHPPEPAADVEEPHGGEFVPGPERPASLPADSGRGWWPRRQGRWLSLGILGAAIGAVIAVAADLQLRHRPDPAPPRRALQRITYE